MIRTTLLVPLAVITTVLSSMPTATAQTAAPPAVQSALPTRPTLPVIGTILGHRAALGPSVSQVETLERLGLDFIHEAIRRQADLQVAQIDLDVVLDPAAGQTVDVKAAGAKAREIEKIRTDLQLALIRAVEAGRAQLTAEQRSALSALLAGTATAQGADPGDDPPNPARGTGHAPPGATGHAPGGSRPAPGVSGHAPPSGGGYVAPGGGVHPRPPAPRPDGHGDLGRRDHDRVIIRGWSTLGAVLVLRATAGVRGTPGAGVLVLLHERAGVLPLRLDVPGAVGSGTSAPAVTGARSDLEGRR